MRFRFTLEGLLRVRKSLEKQEEQKLAVAVGEVRRLTTLLENVRGQIRSSDASMEKRLAAGARGADLHLLCLERVLLERREQTLAPLRASALAEMQKQQANLQTARRERKVLDTLREKQLHHFVLTETRREQQRLDDAYLLRRSYDDDRQGAA